MMPARRTLTTLVAVALLAAAGQAATGQLVVRRGDNLSSLAKRHGISLKSLAAANGIGDLNLIREGQVLRLPDAGGGAPAAAAGRYKVQPGDSLERIAKRHGVSVAALASANRITNRHRIIAGSTLTVPGAGGGGPARASGGATYVVRSGDVLGSIARRHGVSAAALASANGIRNPNRIRIGARLIIPGGGGSGGGGSRLPAKLQADPARMALLAHFDRWAAANGLPANLLKATAWMESGFQNGVRSSTGAMGIGQLMPATVEFVSERLIGVRLDPWNPHENIRMSARYMRWLLERTGSSSGALAAYYQGLRSVRERGVFPETVRYVAAIQELRARF